MKRFDVAIAGGGVIGVCIALELAQAGLKVALFDAREPGREASWASAGIISPAPENAGMIPLVPLCRASAALYPEFVRGIEEISGRNVGFRQKGTLEILLGADAPEELSTIIALHHGLGLKAQPLSAEKARELEPSVTERAEAAILRPQEASVDNRELTPAALQAARSKGVEIFPGEAALGIWREGLQCHGLKLKGGKVEAKWTVIAAGSFSAQIEGAAPYAPVIPAKGQMICLRSDSVKMQRVLWSENIYLVPRNDGRILAGATVERVGFDRTVTAGGLKKLLDAAIELAPELASARVDESWAGLRPDTPDHLPVLGPCDAEGLLFATGHFRSGILLAPVTARLVTEWITTQKVSVDWERFSPMRFLEARQSHGA